MTAKEFFRKAAAAQKDLKRLRAVRTHFEELGVSISPRIGGIVNGGSHGSSRVETAVVGMVDTEAGIEEKIAECQRLVNQAENVIGRIPGERFRQILTLYYLAGWSLPSVADELRYKDRNSIYRAHGFALKEAQKILNRGKESEPG